MQQKQIQQIEHLSKKDQKALAAIFADPAAWGELFLRNRDGSPRSFWDHQKDDLRCRSRHIIHQDGRDVGKSVCIIADLLHYAFTTKGGSGLVAAPHQGHLDTLIDELEFQLGENPDLMSSVAEGRSGHPAIIRKPYFKVGFISGTPDFLEFHQKRAGYRGMRGPVRQAETELGYDEFGREVLQRENNATAD